MIKTLSQQDTNNFRYYNISSLLVGECPVGSPKLYFLPFFLIFTCYVSKSGKQRKCFQCMHSVCRMCNAVQVVNVRTAKHLKDDD